ncbi:protein SCO1 homolog 2, mitochondrial isoform X2 [Phalaenopsis equestris]|uniref:protein SCO1 homolog 2, mitochondrial isoform X2 n=1 Tax=Phalaenopsis equestris TaxID=78828 RepID=UPI0009E2A498|nr:protein SCO1 homolog 2, mitochondrial isoform X2 [Phalaenopsis equestris]
MLMLQTLKMPFRRASRAFGSSILWNRPVSHRFQYRAYAKESNCKDGRLTRNILEEEESSSSQSCGSYIVPAALVVFIGAGAFIHYNDEKRAIPKGSERSTGIGKADTNKPAIGGPFKLFDTENHLVTESNLRGNWILLYFGYTSSPDVGPAEVDKMAKAIDILECQHNLKVKPVYITIDPQRDSPEQLQAYLSEIDPRIKGLTGPISSVRQIAQEYRVFFKKVDEEGQDYLVESSHNMYLLDPNMDTVRWFGAEYDASQLADGILAEVISRKRMNLILKPQSYSRFMREGPKHVFIACYEMV